MAWLIGNDIQLKELLEYKARSPKSGQESSLPTRRVKPFPCGVGRAPEQPEAAKWKSQASASEWRMDFCRILGIPECGQDWQGWHHREDCDVSDERDDGASKLGQWWKVKGKELELKQKNEQVTHFQNVRAGGGARVPSFGLEWRSGWQWHEHARETAESRFGEGEGGDFSPMCCLRCSDQGLKFGREIQKFEINGRSG